MKIALLALALTTCLTGWLQAEPSSPSYERELTKLSTDFGSSLGAAHIKSISISTFTDLNGGETDLGKLLSVDLAVDLANQDRGLSIIDPAFNSQLLGNQKIDAVIVGTIIPLGTSYRVEMKAVASDSGKLLAAKRFLMTRTEELDALMGIQAEDNSPSPNEKPLAFPKNAPIPQAGIALWLNAGAGPKIDAHNLVSLWRDQSGSGHDVTQSAPDHRPLFLPHEVHGKAAVQFNAASCLRTASVVTTGQEYSVFIVSSLGGASGPFYNGDPGSSGWGFSRNSDKATYGMLYGGTADFHLGPVKDPDAEQLLSATRADSVTNFYAFGVLSGAPNFAMSNPTGTAYLGNGPNLNNPFVGNVAELIVYSRKLGDAERQAVERYLSAKYGIALDPSVVQAVNPAAGPPVDEPFR